MFPWKASLLSPYYYLCVVFSANFSLGGTTRNHLAKITIKLDPSSFLKFQPLYIGLFDWIRWAIFSPPMHTLMKYNEHPKTYNMH